MDVKKWQRDTLGVRVAEALIANEFNAVYYSSREEAISYLLDAIKPGMEVGIGGSTTLDELGIPDNAIAKGAIVLNHNLPGLSAEEKVKIRRRQLVCDLFLSGTNALTLDGCLVNLDGVGNRVGAMTFGPEKVIIVTGTNKICADVPAAMKRLEFEAAPQNNKRLALSNPCTLTGSCHDCRSKSRICRIYSVMKKKPMLTDLTVVIIGEDLGY
jgi:hypothetical protein